MKNLLIADDNEQILDVLKEYAIKENYHNIPLLWRDLTGVLSFLKHSF